MSASKPEYPEEYLTENPYEFRRNDPDPPWFTIFSFLCLPVLPFAALPFLKALEPPINLDDDPKVRQFDGLMVFMGFYAVAVAASFLGLILAGIAKKQDEPWKGLRIFSWITNGIVAIYGFFTFLEGAIFALLF